MGVCFVPFDETGYCRLKIIGEGQRCVGDGPGPRNLIACGVWSLAPNGQTTMAFFFWLTVGSGSRAAAVVRVFLSPGHSSA